MTQPTEHLIPKEGRLVRKPDGQALADTGEKLPLTAYWRRRLRDGDVTIKQPKSKAATSKPTGDAQ